MSTTVADQLPLGVLKEAAKIKAQEVLAHRDD